MLQNVLSPCYAVDNKVFQSGTYITLTKDGSWNLMISAHLSGQIFISIETSPYCITDEETNIFLHDLKEGSQMFIKCALEQQAIIRSIWVNQPQLCDPSLDHTCIVYVSHLYSQTCLDLDF